MERPVSNLCPRCMFFNKCKKLNIIHQKLTDYSIDVLDEWGIDVDIRYLIKYCEKFVADLSSIEDYDEDLKD